MGGGLAAGSPVVVKVCVEAALADLFDAAPDVGP